MLKTNSARTTGASSGGRVGVASRTLHADVPADLPLGEQVRSPSRANHTCMDNTTAGARPMGRTLILWIAALSLAAGTATSQGLTAMDTKSKDVLWFDRPAPRFMEAAPIGGGLVGAMVFGGTSEERLALNHKQLWRATKRDAPIPDVADRIPQIRSLFLDGKAPEGARLAREVLDGPTGGVDAYQPVGDLLIRADVGEADEYVQALDMARGVHQTAYTADGVAVVRTSFASGVDHVVVAEVRSSAPIALEFELARIDDPDCKDVKEDLKARLLTHLTATEDPEGRRLSRIHWTI